MRTEPVARGNRASVGAVIFGVVGRIAAFDHLVKFIIALRAL
jgi:hypothetical protein